MGISRLNEWTAEVLTFLELNDEFLNIYNNQGGTFGTPRTAALDMDGNSLILDDDEDTHITANIDDQIDFSVGGADVVVFIPAGILSTTTQQNHLRVAVADVSGRTSLHRLNHTLANSTLETQVLSL